MIRKRREGEKLKVKINVQNAINEGTTADKGNTGNSRTSDVINL